MELLLIDGYCRWLSRHFFVRGHDPEDIFQEARLAAWQAPHCPRVAARRQVLDMVKMANRQPTLVAEVDVPVDDLFDRVAARDALCRLLATPLTENERAAVGRTLRGDPIRRHEKGLQVALWRLRRKSVSA